MKNLDCLKHGSVTQLNEQNKITVGCVKHHLVWFPYLVLEIKIFIVNNVVKRCVSYVQLIEDICLKTEKKNLEFVTYATLV